MKENRQWCETPITTKSPEKKKKVASILVGHVLRAMKEHKQIEKYTRVKPNPENPEPAPTYKVKYKGRDFNLFVTGNLTEFMELGTTLDSDVIVLHIIEGKKVMAPSEIIWSINSKLFHATLFRKEKMSLRNAEF